MVAVTLANTVLVMAPHRWTTPNTMARTAKETAVEITDTIE